MAHYIIEMRDKAIRAIGPFDDQQAAAAWGRDPKNNPEDDPRWQTIELDECANGMAESEPVDEPFILVPVVRPGSA